MVGRTIVIAVDGSPHSKHAFDWYFENWHRQEDQIIVVHCVEHHLGHKKTEEQKHGSEVEQDYEKEIEQRQCQAKFHLGAAHRPGEYIVEMAEKDKADCIIVGTRGSGTLRRTIMGSTSDYVLHHAHCPVLVCRQ